MTWAEINAGIPPANNPQRVALRNNSNMAASIRGEIKGRIDRKVEGVVEPNPAKIHLAWAAGGLIPGVGHPYNQAGVKVF